MNAPRRICAVTGTRADYGLLRWTVHAIAEEPALALQLVVTGAHLSPQFGPPRAPILADGLPIAAEVDMLLADDSPRAVTKSLGLGVIGFADVLERLRPDLLLILGDRYEILAAAQAAMIARIPIAHVHGGEATEGLIDEAIRHQITKMAHIHLVAAQDYARRVIQLGEQPRRVHVVGATGLDAIAGLRFLERPALETALGYSIGDCHLLVTQHPVTLSGTPPEQALAPLLSALDSFPACGVTLTAANADPAGRRFNEILKNYAHERRERVHFVSSLGQLRYLSLARLSTAVVGNSSSGLIEIPALGVPSVNIGARQRQRLRAPSVIDCADRAEAIRDAIVRSRDPALRERAARRISPYGQPGAARRIAGILRDTPLEDLLMKRFYDLPGAAA